MYLYKSLLHFIMHVERMDYTKIHTSLLEDLE